MSGIGGLLRLDGAAAARSDAERMLARLAHRGPDGAGVWCVGTAGLGHRLLHTTPESLRERLPLASPDGSLVLTADARIDNRAELCSVLSAPSDVSDGELILRAYERWGERCPEHLLGDFAFAIWDARRDILFCARDHFGVKAFYYHHAPGQLFCFASEIKGLLALAEVPRRLNETRVADYLVPLLEDKVITFYEGIVRLPPAHRMTVSQQGMRIEPYWALDPEREIRMNSDEEYAEAFREIFTEAVRCRLRSAFPMGSMLSGGLDSSSIVCIARGLRAENGGGSLHTFSAIFPDLPECDEREYINAVVSGGGVASHFVSGVETGPLGDLDRMLDCEDEPFYAPNLFIPWATYRAARLHGVRAQLDGFDGDSTVAHSMVYLSELARGLRWASLAREVVGLSKRFSRSPWTILANHVAKPLTPQPLRKMWRSLRGRSELSWMGSTIANPTFERRMRLRERATALSRDHARAAQTSRGDHHHRITRGLMPFALEVLDRAAAAFGIEPRYPFFDRRLIEFCLALPANQKLNRGWTRVVMRRALVDILPDRVRLRGGKANLSPAFTKGLAGPNAQLLKSTLLSPPGIAAAYLDMGAVRKAYDHYCSEGAESDALAVWKATTLAEWLRRTERPENEKRRVHA